MFYSRPVPSAPPPETTNVRQHGPADPLVAVIGRPSATSALEKLVRVTEQSGYLVEEMGVEQLLEALDDNPPDALVLFRDDEQCVKAAGALWCSARVGKANARNRPSSS